MGDAPTASIRLLMVAAIAVVGAACGSDGASDRASDGDVRTSPARAATEVPANTDAAGRAQEVPAHLRIDVGGAEDLRPFVLAAADRLHEEHPDQAVTVDDSAYGDTAWGLCLGSSEAAALDDREGWGIETCEKSGIRIISLPVADGVWLAVGNRAAMRPEVARYVGLSLEAAPEAARRAGVEPLSAPELRRTRAQWQRFLADERAVGTQPLVG